MHELSPSTPDLFPDAGPAVAGPAGAAQVVARDLMSPARRYRRQKRGVLFWASVAWVLALTACALLADHLPFVDPYSKIFATAFKQPPSADHWFGTDKIGHDVFSRCIYGARLSLAIAGASIVFGLFLGGLLGLVAGYYRRTLDTVIVTAMDVVLAFPALVLALAVTAFLGHSARTVILALSILSVPPLARIVRASTLVYAQREFVLAARGIGAKGRRILFREVLPNIVPAMLSFALTGLAVLIVAEGALAFLGQSVPPPIPTWGKLVADGQQDLDTAWWISLMPALMMFLTILAFNIMGDVLARRFQVREAGA
jgi:peptide/nickel transport system permease protein